MVKEKNALLNNQLAKLIVKLIKASNKKEKEKDEADKIQIQQLEHK